MIHFHQQTTFEVFPSLLILVHSWNTRYDILQAQLVDEKSVLAGTIP